MAARCETPSSELCIEMKSSAMIAQSIHWTVIMKDDTILTDHLRSKAAMNCILTYTMRRSLRSKCPCPGIRHTMPTKITLYAHSSYISGGAFYHSKFQLEKKKCL